MTWKGCGRRQS